MWLSSPKYDNPNTSEVGYEKTQEAMPTAGAVVGLPREEPRGGERWAHQRGRAAVVCLQVETHGWTFAAYKKLAPWQQGVEKAGKLLSSKNGVCMTSAKCKGPLHERKLALKNKTALRQNPNQGQPLLRRQQRGKRVTPGK